VACTPTPIGRTACRRNRPLLIDDLDIHVIKTVGETLPHPRGATTRNGQLSGAEIWIFAPEHVRWTESS